MTKERIAGSNTKYCVQCGKIIRAKAEICLHRGVGQFEPAPHPQERVDGLNDVPTRPGKRGRNKGSLLALILCSLLIAFLYLHGRRLPSRSEDDTQNPSTDDGGGIIHPSVIRSAVANLLKDPSSAQFADANAYDDRTLGGKKITVVCGEVNAKNSLGGYVGMKHYIYFPNVNKVTFDYRADPNFAKLWKWLCAGVHIDGIHIGKRFLSKN